MYPVWLRGVGLARKQSRGWIVATPLMSAVAALIAALFFYGLSGDYPMLTVHAFLFGVIGLLSTIAWAGAIKLSSEGKPGWLASVTLAANLLACVCLVVFNPSTSGGRVSALLAGQVAGWVVGITVLTARNRGVYQKIWSANSSPGDAIPTGSDRANYWYLVQASAGYGSILTIQTQTAALPSTALSTLGVFTRVLAGLSALTTNAILPQARPLAVCELVGGISLSPSLVRCDFGVSLDLADSGRLGSHPRVARLDGHSGLVRCDIAQCATVKRVAVRELPPRVAWISTTANLAMPIVVVAVAAFGHLSIGLVLGPAVALDLLPGRCVGHYP